MKYLSNSFISSVTGRHVQLALDSLYLSEELSGHSMFL
jgi:hypothetical protein